MSEQPGTAHSKREENKDKWVGNSNDYVCFPQHLIPLGRVPCLSLRTWWVHSSDQVMWGHQTPSCMLLAFPHLLCSLQAWVRHVSAAHLQRHIMVRPVTHHSVQVCCGAWTHKHASCLSCAMQCCLLIFLSFSRCNRIFLMLSLLTHRLCKILDILL